MTCLDRWSPGRLVVRIFYILVESAGRSKRKSEEPCGTPVLAIVDRELEIRACGEIYRKGQLMNREGERENSHYLKHKHEHKALASHGIGGDGRGRRSSKHRGEPVHAGQRPVPVHCTTKEQRPGTRCNINYGSRISSTRATTALSTTAAAATAAFASTWACMHSAGVGSAAASLSQGV